MPYNAKLARLSESCFGQRITRSHSKLFPTKLLMSPLYSLCLALKTICIFAQLVLCQDPLHLWGAIYRWHVHCCPGNSSFDTRHCTQDAMGRSLTFYLPCTISGNAPCQKAHRPENCLCRCLGPSSRYLFPFLTFTSSLLRFFLYVFVQKVVGTFQLLLAQSFNYL